MRIETDQDLIDYYDQSIEVSSDFKNNFPVVLQQLRKLEKQLETVKVPTDDFIREYMKLNRVVFFGGDSLSPMSRSTIERNQELIKNCYKLASEGCPWIDIGQEPFLKIFRENGIKVKQEFFEFAIKLEAWFKNSFIQDIKEFSKQIEEHKEFINGILKRKEEYNQLISHRHDLVYEAMSKHIAIFNQINQK